MGCKNRAIHKLEIAYIRKLGWFCSQCRSYLVLHGIAFDSPTHTVTLDELGHSKDNPEKHSKFESDKNGNRNARFTVTQKQLGGDLKQ